MSSSPAAAASSAQNQTTRTWRLRCRSVSSLEFGRFFQRQRRVIPQPRPTAWADDYESLRPERPGQDSVANIASIIGNLIAFQEVVAAFQAASLAHLNPR